MIANLREAKEQLSALVKRAASGEDIIITVRGQPMARLSSAQPNSAGQQFCVAFADELAQLAESVRTDAAAIAPQNAWDQLRADRF